MFIILGRSDLRLMKEKLNQEEKKTNRTINVKTYDGRHIDLSVLRIVNEGEQPLILWPGFGQNGFVYDLMPNGGSLGEYLWENDFDIWIIHSRGTGGSGGKKYSASLDDYASSDIPTVIEYVKKQTSIKPIYVGHSQGGNTAIMSMMGTYKKWDGSVELSKKHAEDRQKKLKGLVTIGSFLDFTFSRTSPLQEFVKKGPWLKIRLLSTKQLLKLLKIFLKVFRLKYIPLNVWPKLRNVRLTGEKWKFIFPLYFLLDRIARLKIWKHVYHIQNVTAESRLYLFYRTIDGTFWDILNQYYQAVRYEVMKSSDERVNYSENYHLIKLPVSFVSVEYDIFADPDQMEVSMFKKVSSIKKEYTAWKQMGHEDHFMHPKYFPLVLEAIKKVC